MPRGSEEYYDDDRPRGHSRQSGDLIVKNQEFAYILDETKGLVSVIVGPQKMSLAQTDKTVVFDAKKQRFVSVSLSEAVQTFVQAKQGTYIELQNPAAGSVDHPAKGTMTNSTDLNYGCKVNLAGPKNFPLWPGQVVAVLDGHTLRSNQYLICRVYDDSAAKENIEDAVIKTATDESSAETSTKQQGRKTNLLPSKDELVTGKLFIIKGTAISFFIPPNGIEVLPDTEGKYVRDAVTLEQLEYCILLDENGDKRFEKGPQVVFPKPTERFLKRKNEKGRVTRRFRAIELNDISGIYVKVIAAYEDEEGNKHEEGEEMWVTGKEQRIYFPRPEHSLIKYDNREIHYAVAVPKGEAKYVLNRETGVIALVRGPAMFLPDPRKEILVRRILDTDQAATWYPGNSEVLDYNASLTETASSEADGFVTDRQYKSSRRSRGLTKKSLGAFGRDELESVVYAAAASNALDEGDFNLEKAAGGMGGETISRKASFTRPMSVSIDSKFDGAVIVRPWTGYAVQIVDGEGNRKVVQGPAVVQLEYDEDLETFALSTGKRKSTDHMIRDVYLRVLNNRVSDTITVETSDMVKVDIAVSYHVNFEGDPDKWFNVENYVQHLCDNIRSILRNVAKQHDIQSFYNKYIDIIRNTVIPMDDDGVREGRLFPENGMRITEVEVLECIIGDRDIQHMLERSQVETARALIDLNQGQKKFQLEQAQADLEKMRAELATTTESVVQAEHRKRLAEQDKTDQERHELGEQARQRSFEAESKEQENEHQLQTDRVEAELSRQETLDQISAAKLEREKARANQTDEVRRAETADYVNRLKAEAAKAVEESGAVQPGLVEALTALSKAGMLEKITKELAPLAIVRGVSIGGAITQLFEGTPFQDTVEKLVQNVEGGNGAGGAFHMSRGTHDEDRWHD